MKALRNGTKEWALRLWRGDRALTGTAGLMLVVLAFSLAGLALDPRTITGAPAWLKPAKFAASIAIYTLTTAWIFTYLPGWGRTRRFAGGITAAVFLVEMAAIALQAARGIGSHFNVAAPLDAAIFGVMGIAILVQTLASVVVAAALWRQPFTDRALGWAFRLGLTISILGASVGGIMTRPTSEQLATGRAAARPTVLGAHTVGAPDGGPGLPGTNWSVSHGDLRVPHFFGIHAMQALPFLALALGRRRLSERTRVRFTVAASASYATLFAILLAQALAGQPVLRPQGTVALALVLWALATALTLSVSVFDRKEIAHVTG